MPNIDGFSQQDNSQSLVTVAIYNKSTLEKTKRSELDINSSIEIKVEEQDYTESYASQIQIVPPP